MASDSYASGGIAKKRGNCHLASAVATNCLRFENSALQAAASVVAFVTPQARRPSLTGSPRRAAPIFPHANKSYSPAFAPAGIPPLLEQLQCAGPGTSAVVVQTVRHGSRLQTAGSELPATRARYRAYPAILPVLSVRVRLVLDAPSIIAINMCERPRLYDEYIIVVFFPHPHSTPFNEDASHRISC